MRASSLIIIAIFILSCCLNPVSGLFRGPAPLLQPHSENYIPPIPANLTAYVSIHTQTFSHRDRYQIEGILTMFQTLRETSPNIARDQIVAVTSNTPQSIRNEYESHSLKIIEIPSNTKSFPSTVCDDRMNKIHLWNSELFPYERIIFIDSDVLIIHNLDLLFQCSHFCMVYSSIQHFTDSIFVIKPEKENYQKILIKYNKLEIHDWMFIPRSYCAEESWHFFLYLFGDMESAPLFEQEHGQANLPIQRLSSSVSLNAMMYYEFFTWRLMRGKEFRNYSDDDGIPSYSLSFTGLKPFNFAPGIFFNLNWLWHKERDRVLNKNYTIFLISWSIYCFLLLWFYFYGIQLILSKLMRERKKGESFYNFFQIFRILLIKIFGYSGEDLYKRTDNNNNNNNNNNSNNNNRSMSPTILSLSTLSLTTMSNISKFSLFYYWLPLIGLTPLCLILAFLFININGWFLYWTINILTPPHIAWTIFVICHLLLTACDLQFLRFAAHFAPQKFQIQTNRKITADNNATHVNENIDTEEEEEIHSLLEKDQLLNDEFPSSSSLQSSSSSSSSSHYRQSIPPFNFTRQLNSSPLIEFSLTDFISVTFWEFFTFLSMRWKKYPEFVVKMFAIFPMVAGILIAHVNIWRFVIGQIEKQIEPNAKNQINNRK